MRRWMKILCIVLALLVALLAGLYWWQRENLKAVKDAASHSSEELEEKLAENQQQIRKESGLETGNVAATRGDVLKALYIAAGSPAVADTSALARFNDASAISSDMAPIAAWAAQQGILKGYLDGSAGLGNNATRGQACALAGRTMGALA